VIKSPTRLLPLCSPDIQLFVNHLKHFILRQPGEPSDHSPENDRIFLAEFETTGKTLRERQTGDIGDARMG
jgi:hypothetical protein